MGALSTPMGAHFCETPIMGALLCDMPIILKTDLLVLE